MEFVTKQNLKGVHPVVLLRNGAGDYERIFVANISSADELVELGKGRAMRIAPTASNPELRPFGKWSIEVEENSGNET